MVCKVGVMLKERVVPLLEGDLKRVLTFCSSSRLPSWSLAPFLCGFVEGIHSLSSISSRTGHE